MAMLRILALLAFPLPLAAQEVTGTISGTLQGYDSSWSVTRSAEGGLSDWSGDESWAWISLTGHATANTVLDLTGALTLAFELGDGATDPHVLAREITYSRQPGILFRTRPGSGEVEVTAAVFDEADLHLEGRFAATLYRLGPDGSEVLPPETRVVAGTFTADLLLLE
jgi:hypothetical protein